MEDVRQQEKKKKHLEEKNYQDNLQQRNYLDSQISSTMRNTREDQKEIGDNGKGDKQEKKKLQKQFGRKKKKLSEKNQKLENVQKKMKRK